MVEQVFVISLVGGFAKAVGFLLGATAFMVVVTLTFYLIGNRQ